MKDIGKGSFGKVKLVLNSNDKNKPCAMKVLSKRKLNKIFVGKNRTAMHDVMQEIAIMKKLVNFTVLTHLGPLKYSKTSWSLRWPISR